MTVVSCLYKVKRDAGQTIKRMFWQISEGSDSRDHTLIALSHCPRGVFCAEGLHAQMKLFTYGATIESGSKVVF